MATGARPTFEEYVLSTEKMQLQVFEPVRKKVRVGASKYRASLKEDEDKAAA